MVFYNSVHGEKAVISTI